MQGFRASANIILTYCISHRMFQCQPRRVYFHMVFLTCNVFIFYVSSVLFCRWLNAATSSGMSMVSARALTGYDFDTTNLLQSYSSLGLKRFDRTQRNLNLYFDEVGLCGVALIQPPRVNRSSAIMILTM